MSVQKRALFVLVAGLCSFHVAANAEEGAGLIEPCGMMPHCVSSANKMGSFHYIAPINVPNGEKYPWVRLKQVLAKMDGVKVVQESGDRLKLECTTKMMKFTDDVEFVLNKSLGEFEVRSSSRVGISDLGANRRRIEAIRTAFDAQGNTSAP